MTTSCHSLSLIVILCHLLHHLFALIVTCCTTCSNSLSLAVIYCHLLYHFLSPVTLYIQPTRNDSCESDRWYEIKVITLTKHLLWAHSSHYCVIVETTLETSQVSMIELFAKINNGYKTLNIFTKKFQHKFLTVLQIHLCIAPYSTLKLILLVY